MAAITVNGAAPWRRHLRIERGSHAVLGAAAATSIVVVVLVVFFLSVAAWPAVVKVGLDRFFGSATWDPEGAYHVSAFGLPQPKFGAWTPIFGSLTTVALALLIAVPVGLSLAIVLVEINRKLGEKLLRPAIELFLGVPSIVYGYLGLTVLIPLLQPLSPPGRTGAGFAAAAIVLGIMVIPTVATLAADAIGAQPRTLREGSFALGATQWQTLRHVILPAARSGIVTGIVLGLARAMGEALAIALVIGNSPNPPDFTHGTRFLFEPGMTMTTTITDGITELGANPLAEASRYLLAIVLLVITFSCVMIVRTVQTRSGAKR